MTGVLARTCRLALVMGVALFGANQARAAGGTDITHEVRKWRNPV